MPRRKVRQKRSHAKMFFYPATAIVAILLVASLFGPSLNYLSINNANLLSTISLSLLFSTLVISYMLHKGTKPSKIIPQLGLSRDKLTMKTAGYGCLLFLIYIAIIVGISAFSYATNSHFSTNVQQVVGSYPIWALIFVSIIAPLNEEIAFRAFLVPRIGIIFSGIIFAILHLSYGSWVELAVVLWFGLSAGYVFKKTKSLYPSLITHIMVNSVTAIGLIAVMHGGPSMLAMVFR